LLKSSRRNKWNDKNRTGALGNKTILASFPQTQIVATPVLFGWEQENGALAVLFCHILAAVKVTGAYVGTNIALLQLEAKRHSPRFVPGR